MKRATRKFLSAFLALSMVLAILPVLAPQTAYAADANNLKSTIDSYTGGEGASGRLYASVSGSTVTVTGSMSNVSETLTLNIDEGMTVNWTANIESTEVFSPVNPDDAERLLKVLPLIALDGAGSFVVSGSSAITAHYAVALRAASDATVSITVKDTARVTTTGTSNSGNVTIQLCRTIETYGDVKVEDNASLEAYNATVIYAQGAASQVTISGGTLQNNATHYSNPVVHALGESSKVTVCGTGEVHAYTQNGYAVSAKGDVEVSGSAKISAVAGGSAVSVSGNGSEVSVYGGTITGVGSAIDGGISSATVVTIDGGSVTSTGSKAISISSSPGSSATISGGTVGNGTADGNSTYTAISAHTVNVSGGTVYGYTTSSFGVIFGTNVNISGTANVQSRVDGARAIYGGFVDITGGEVSATTGGAVYNSSDGGFVTVSGGRVFSYAGTIRSTSGEGVLNFYNFCYDDSEKLGFTGATGTGMVIGWNKAAWHTSYTAGDSVDIVKSPDAATAVWAKSGAEHGIFYENGSNVGFIPLAVTVTGAADPAPELSAGTAARTGETQASIGFTTSEAGTAYYKAVEKGAAAPGFDASGWTPLGAVSGTVTGKSVTLTAGAKDIYVVVEDISGNASDALIIVVGSAPPVVYAIALDVTDTYTFPSALEGYGAQAEKPVAVSNTGNQATGPLTISLSGSGADSFILSKTSMTDIATNGGDSFTVTPKDGLATGTHTATVMVSGGNGISESFAVSFTVGARSIPVSGITVSGGSGIIVKNGTLQLSVSVLPTDAANKAVTWSIVSGNSYASVSPSGLVTAIANGTVKVRATAQDGSGVYGEKTINISGQSTGGNGGGGYTQPAESTGTVYNHVSQPSATVWLSGSGFSAGDLLVTETLTKGGDYNALIQLAEKGDILRVYDISLKSGKRQDGGAMHLTFALGAGYAGQSFTLVHKKADGTFEYLYATANANGQVKFGPLYELSPFMLVKGTLLYLPTDQILNVPKTGESSGTLPFALLALAALCGMGAVLYRKKQTRA